MKNALSKSLQFLVKLYQYTFGLVLPPACRFHPTCSEYAREALQTHSLHYAIWLIVKRLLKCQPLCKGGIDPVPLRLDVRK
jgi:putative membrane protein insertion efficiency factor